LIENRIAKLFRLLHRKKWSKVIRNDCGTCDSWYYIFFIYYFRNSNVEKRRPRLNSAQCNPKINAYHTIRFFCVKRLRCATVSKFHYASDCYFATKRNKLHTTHDRRKCRVTLRVSKSTSAVVGDRKRKHYRSAADEAGNVFVKTCPAWPVRDRKSKTWNRTLAQWLLVGAQITSCGWDFGYSRDGIIRVSSPRQD
jgi:hypothetical protein